VVAIGADLARSIGASPAKAAAKDKGGAAAACVEGSSRALNNQGIHPGGIGDAGFAATARRAASSATLLAIQDTTTLSYSHSAREDLGDLGGPKNAKARGLFVHSSLLVDAITGATVGLIDQEVWARDPKERGQRHERKKRPYEDKESFKWQQGAERERARLGDELMARTISVCDREADIYEYLAFKQEHRERFAIRASWDRTVETEMTGLERAHLFEALEHAPIYGHATVEVPQRGGRPARSAQLTIRATRVRLKRPPRSSASSKKLPSHLWVNAVLAKEATAPAGVAEPLEWLLFTSEPIATSTHVETVLGYYRRRWRIEDFHKAWKTGAGVERRRPESRDNIHRIAVLLAFVAVRLLQLRERVEATPQAPCDEVLTLTEWKVLWAVVEKKRPPKKVPSMRWAHWAIGSLAGWIDSKRTGRMGWDTFWEGWRELERRIDGYRVAFLVGEEKT
jgi:hypothetical protein